MFDAHVQVYVPTVSFASDICCIQVSYKFLLFNNHIFVLLELLPSLIWSIEHPILRSNER